MAAAFPVACLAAAAVLLAGCLEPDVGLPELDEEQLLAEGFEAATRLELDGHEGWRLIEVVAPFGTFLETDFTFDLGTSDETPPHESVDACGVIRVGHGGINFVVRDPFALTAAGPSREVHVAALQTSFNYSFLMLGGGGERLPILFGMESPTDARVPNQLTVHANGATFYWRPIENGDILCGTRAQHFDRYEGVQLDYAVGGLTRLSGMHKQLDMGDGAQMFVLVSADEGHRASLRSPDGVEWESEDPGSDAWADFEEYAARGVWQFDVEELRGRRDVYAMYHAVRGIPAEFVDALHPDSTTTRPA